MFEKLNALNFSNIPKHDSELPGLSTSSQEWPPLFAERCQDCFQFLLITVSLPHTYVALHSLLQLIMYIYLVVSPTCFVSSIQAYSYSYNISQCFDIINLFCTLSCVFLLNGSNASNVSVLRILLYSYKIPQCFDTQNSLHSGSIPYSNSVSKWIKTPLFHLNLLLMDKNTIISH